MARQLASLEQERRALGRPAQVAPVRQHRLLARAETDRPLPEKVLRPARAELLPGLAMLGAATFAVRQASARERIGFGQWTR